MSVVCEWVGVQVHVLGTLQTLFTSLMCCCGADLLAKLSGERSRWGQQLAELDGQLQQLPTAALLLAATVSYLPAHPEDVREAVLPAWARWGCAKPGYTDEPTRNTACTKPGRIKSTTCHMFCAVVHVTSCCYCKSSLFLLQPIQNTLQCSAVHCPSMISCTRILINVPTSPHCVHCSQLGLPGFNPMAFMSSESQLLTWQAQGLPRDDLSGQNALAILHGVQTSFIIDPSSQVGGGGGGPAACIVLSSCDCAVGYCQHESFGYWVFLSLQPHKPLLWTDARNVPEKHCLADHCRPHWPMRPWARNLCSKQ